MEVLKSEQKITPILGRDVLSLFDEGIFLWVIHADKIPPHLGISKGKTFYSLKANGKDDGLSVDKVLPILNRKDIATVFYEIRSDRTLVDFQKAFDQFETTVPGKITCLEPLKLIFNVPEATWLKELLFDLEHKEYILRAFGWQLPADFERIPDYNPKDIHRRLEQLNNV